ncbi:hypothetical protein HRU45_05085 [Candidatus Dependentiae bacterium]|nr:hypothetical protein [Candidatus Dependentiae bacterium]
MKKKLLFLTALLLQGLAAPVLASESAPSVASSPVAAATGQTSPGIISNLWSIAGSVVKSGWNVGSFALNTVLGCIKGLCTGVEKITASKWTMIPAGVASVYGAYYWHQARKFKAPIKNAKRYLKGTGMDEQDNLRKWPSTDNGIGRQYNFMAWAWIEAMPDAQYIQNRDNVNNIIKEIIDSKGHLKCHMYLYDQDADQLPLHVRMVNALRYELETVRILREDIDKLVPAGSLYAQEAEEATTTRARALEVSKLMAFPKRAEAIKYGRELQKRYQRLDALLVFIERNSRAIDDEFMNYNHLEDDQDFA